MLLHNTWPRLALFVPLAFSLLVAVCSCTDDLDWLSRRHRMQVVRRQVANDSDSSTISSTVTGVLGGGLAPRLEIRELQKNADQWNLYLLALLRFQEVDQDDQFSYYQIAGEPATESPFERASGVCC